jgi:NAD-dependent DNA ligase
MEDKELNKEGEEFSEELNKEGEEFSGEDDEIVSEGDEHTNKGDKPEEEKLQEEVVGKAADKERKEPENKEDAAVVHAKPKRRLTAKYLALSGTFPHLEEGEGLELGKPSLKEIIASHGGIVDDKVQGRTNILVIGDRPGKVKVRDATKGAVQIVHIYT